MLVPSTDLAEDSELMAQVTDYLSKAEQEIAKLKAQVEAMRAEKER